MSLTNFYRDTGKNFTVLVKENGVPLDISGDTVRLIIKKSKSDIDSSALVDKNADVTTDGVNGNALFALSPANLDFAPGKYWHEISYIPLGNEYILFQGIVACLEKVADV